MGRLRYAALPRAKKKMVSVLVVCLDSGGDINHLTAEAVVPLF